MVEMKEQLNVTDMKGNKIGVMNIEVNWQFMWKQKKAGLFWNLFQQVAPCDSSGREYNEADDMFVDSPDELVGKEVNFVFKIVNCRWA